MEYLELLPSNKDNVSEQLRSVASCLTCVFWQQGETRLCRFTHDAVEDLLQDADAVLVFLGVEKRKKPSSSPEAAEAGETPAWFALGVNADAAELLLRCREQNCSFPKAPTRDLLKLSEDEAGEDLWELTSINPPPSDLCLSVGAFTEPVDR